VREFPALPKLVRTPVIPGFNDSEGDIAAIADFSPAGER
jgi:pyruvate formate lyase activating enzyme